MPVVDGEKNLDKLSNEDLKKALNAKSGSDFLNVVMNQKNRTKAVSENTSADQVEQAAHAVDPTTYEANVNEQTTLMVDGSQVINERIEELKNRLKGKDEKTSSTTLKLEDMNVGETTTKETEEIDGQDLDL